ncbi:MAG: hypothetical protein JWQ21_3544 [Herminiimonas sp.]|nr:hypothetical protein [Herminiimonas sp.]
MPISSMKKNPPLPACLARYIAISACDIKYDGATAALKSWLLSTAGASYLTQDRQQWTVRYSRDLGTQNGFKNADELTLRYLVFF